MLQWTTGLDYQFTAKPGYPETAKLNIVSVGTGIYLNGFSYVGYGLYRAYYAYTFSDTPCYYFSKVSKVQYNAV